MFNVQAISLTNPVMQIFFNGKLFAQFCFGEDEDITSVKKKNYITSSDLHYHMS